MRYEKVQPTEALKGYVRYFWTLENSPCDILPTTFGAIADGSPGIIFQQSGNGNFYQDSKELPSVFLYGQTTRYTQLLAPGKFRTIGAYFYPHALKSVFGFNAAELTNSCLDADLIPAGNFLNLSAQLMNTAELPDQIQMLSAYLLNQIERHRRFDDQLTTCAVAEMIKAKGDINLKILQDQLGLSERNFERRFKCTVGVPPKLLSRIFRFQSSMDLLRDKNFSKLSDIAFKNNYADQSHFIRSFKEFAGVSPNQYQKKSNELVHNFPEIKTC